MLIEAYKGAMKEFLAGRGEAELERASETVRQALAQGSDLLELLSAHRTSVRDSLRAQATGPDGERVLEKAFDCFAESLAPFEMLLREAHESTERLERSLTGLQAVEQQLRSQNEELAVAHKSVEKELRRYRTLFDFAPDGYLVTGIE